MSGHTSRSRSPSSDPNASQNSPAFGQSQSMDPSLFNSSVYQAGANFNQNQYLNTNQMSPSYGMQDMSGQSFSNEFSFEGKNGMMNGGLMVDPALENGNGSVNPTELMGGMSPQDQMSPTSAFSSGLGSQHHSPAMQQGGFGGSSPGHSRHVSLDPSSAGIGQGPASEWTGHRRSPSDQSDVSSVHSPYQNGADFDNFEPNHSPLLNPSSDPSLFPEGIDMNRFTLSDVQRRASMSQQGSPYISPSLVPAPANSGLPEGQFVLPSNIGSDPHGMGDIGQASQLETPQINVEFAPAGQGQLPMGPDANAEALSPPQRGRASGRNRAKSDTSLGPGPMSRPLSPSELSPTFAPQPGMLNADINQPQRHRSLSPFDATFPANYRGSSPGRSSSSRRSSTSSINPNRDYILELADPNRPSAGSGSGTRVQKHPATFQCTMCPKRFTRAYNLRSHLRTHTDERPFVCSVCGKAFARQHDRKRHEGLHSGEKKFVCKGDLANGQGQWGCGRRFARADALGRHFRSEAGRVCIKPLLDEELAEKRRAYEASVLAGAGIGPHMGQMPPGGIAPPAGVLPSQGTGVDLGMSAGAAGGVGGGAGFALPQAILMQYPALQGLQWDQMGNGPVGEDDGGISGRSSFDASGEVYEDEDGYLSGPGTAYAHSGGGWASDQGGM